MMLKSCLALNYNCSYEEKNVGALADSQAFFWGSPLLVHASILC